MSAQSDLIAKLRIEPEGNTSRGRSGWPLFIVLLVLLAVAAVWWWWQQSQRVAVDTVLPQPIVITQTARQASVLDASGYVVARRRATVSSQVTGKVVDVLVEEGMVVEVGQVLARLDDETEQAQLALAQAQLDASRSALREIEVQLADARRTFKRQDELLVPGLTTQANFDRALADVEALEARLASRGKDVAVAQRVLALREELLDQLIVRAPFSGVVIAKAAQPGEMISPISAGGGFTRTGICTLVDMDSREIEVDVNEAYIQRVSPGQPAVARLDAYPDWEVAARVVAIVPTADRQKASVKVRLAIEQLDPRILPEMGVKVRFLEDAAPPVSGPTETAALTVPDAALRRIDGRDYLYVVGVEGVVEQRAVQLGERRADRVIVVAGLRDSERVVSPLPPTGLATGQRVNISERGN